jgi:hypothetical protein
MSKYIAWMGTQEKKDIQQLYTEVELKTREI